MMNPFTSRRETTRQYPAGQTAYTDNNMKMETNHSSRFSNFNQSNPPRSFQSVNPNPSSFVRKDWRSGNHTNQPHNYYGLNEVQVNKTTLNQMGSVSNNYRQEQPRSSSHDGGNYDQSYHVPPRIQENRILTTPRAFQTNANHSMHVSNYVQGDSRPSSSSTLLLLEPPTPRQNLQTKRPLVASGSSNFSKPSTITSGVLKNSTMSTQNTSMKDEKMRIVIGDSPQEKVRFLVGTIERAIKWNKLYKDSLCYYEVVGAVISLQEGNIRLQKKMLLRDNKGPILQVLYYQNCYIDIEDFHIGQKLRCVGRMIGYNMLSAVRIKNVAEDDVIYLYLERYCHFGDQAIAKALKSTP